MLKPDANNPSLVKPLKALDISYNPITNASLTHFADLLEVNRTLEYLGLAKSQISEGPLQEVLDKIGRIPIPAEQVEVYQAKLKARDVIAEKNKKLKASKKPEEPLPQLDLIE